MAADHPAFHCYRTVSDHARIGAFGVLIVLALAWSIVLFVRPIITDKVLLAQVYPISVAKELVSKHGKFINEAFAANMAMLDFPYDQIATRHLAASTEVERSQTLARFLNTKGAPHEEYVTLLLGAPEIRQRLAQFVTDRELDAQTITVPVVGLSLGRMNSMYSLVAAFSVLYFYTLAHRAYAHRLRSDALDQADGIHDASFLTASRADLSVLRRSQRIGVILCRWAFLIGAPVGMFVALLETREPTPGDPESWKILGFAAFLLISTFGSILLWIDKNEALSEFEAES